MIAGWQYGCFISRISDIEVGNYLWQQHTNAGLYYRRISRTHLMSMLIAYRIAAGQVRYMGSFELQGHIGHARFFYFGIGNGGAALWQLTTYCLAGLFRYGIKSRMTMRGVCEALCVEVYIQ